MTASEKPFINKLTRPETPRAFEARPGRYAFVEDLGTYVETPPADGDTKVPA